MVASPSAINPTTSIDTILGHRYMASPSLQSPTFLTDHHLRIGDLDLYCDYRWDGDEPVPPEMIGVQKERQQIERYLELAQRFQAKTIMELGIRQGGSTALLHALFRPDRLVAIELSQTRAAGLDAYIARNGLSAVVRPHYGVNQADRERIPAIAAADFGGRPLDLIVDDASHLLDESRASFDMLFPHLQPGGLYIIEDWNADQLLADGIAAIAGDPSHPRHRDVTRNLAVSAASRAGSPDHRLVRLALELVLARASAGDVIRDIAVMENWIIVQRGSASAGSDFSLASHAKDHFSNLA